MEIGKRFDYMKEIKEEYGELQRENEALKKVITHWTHSEELLDRMTLLVSKLEYENEKLKDLINRCIDPKFLFHGSPDHELYLKIEKEIKDGEK